MIAAMCSMLLEAKNKMSRFDSYDLVLTLLLISLIVCLRAGGSR